MLNYNSKWNYGFKGINNLYYSIGNVISVILLSKCPYFTDVKVSDDYR